MRSILFLAALFGLSLHQSAMGAEARRYRWFPRQWKPLPHLVTATAEKILTGKDPDVPAELGLGSLHPHQELLGAGGELVQKGEQALGRALVDGTWTQTIFHRDGHVLYAAGSVFDELPENVWLPRLGRMDREKSAAMEIAASLSDRYRNAFRKFPPQVRLRPGAEGFQAYWRLEYVPWSQDKILFLHLGEKGDLLEEGEVSVSSAEGKALVFPRGPKFSPLTEVALLDLLGDGTLSHSRFRITSALNLDVRKPDLNFFFQANDRRLDLAQVYFMLEKSFLWFKDMLGVQLRNPVEVRLHVGNDGVSNAAFYHDDVIYLGTGDGVLYQDLTRDPTVVIHESIHAMIDDYVGLPTEGEGGAFNEGFADFFTALILNNPRMGENSYLKGPFRRTMENDFLAYRDFSDGIYKNGSIIAATLWEMRPAFGDKKLAQLAFRTLTRLGKGGGFADFVPSLLNAASGLLTAEEQETASRILQKRGWVLLP